MEEAVEVAVEVQVQEAVAQVFEHRERLLGDVIIVPIMIDVEDFIVIIRVIKISALVTAGI